MNISSGKIWRLRAEGVTLHTLSGRELPRGAPEGGRKQKNVKGFAVSERMRNFAEPFRQKKGRDAARRTPGSRNRGH